MRLILRLVALGSLLAALLTGCGATAPRAHRRPPRSPAATRPRQPHGPAARARRAVARYQRPQALVTAETENRLFIVDLRTGAEIARIAVPAGPQYVAAEPGAAVVTSPNAGAVTLVQGQPLHVVRVLHGFGAPHIVELSPDGQHAYVTDDARGTLSVIGFDHDRVGSTIHVGAGAHHMSSSPDQSRLWIALGESARTIVIVDTSNIDHPRVIGRFNPGFPAHDVSWDPDGRRVWISSASGPDVGVFSASEHRLLFRVHVGSPPQHIAFDGPYAYVTSGYASTIEKVLADTGKIVARATTPYGSFELDAADGFVATASLLNGKLAIYDEALKLRRVINLAPAMRDVEILQP